MTDEEKLAAEAKVAEEAAAKTTADAAAAAAASDGKQSGEITFSPEQQAHIDTLLADRVRRAETAARKKALEEAAAEQKKAAMDETERLKTEKEEAEKRATDAVARADHTLVVAEGMVAAVAAGAAPEKAAHILKLADLSTVEVTEGMPDAAAIKAAIEAVKGDVPELFHVNSGTQRSGGDFGSSTSKARTYPQSEFAKLCADEAYFAEHQEELLAANREGRIIYGK